MYRAIAETVDEDDQWERLDIARNIPIKNTIRIGRYKVSKNRPISISFEKKAHADTLMDSRDWLPQGVTVSREYSQDVENQRKLLRPILKLARSIKHYNGKCKLQKDHLVIHGIKYGVEDLHKLPSDLSGFHASSKQDKRTHVFFGELSLFSNFHKAKFTLNGKEYFCSEQYIQEQKALHYGDTHRAQKILLADSAFECKEIGREIVGGNENQWKKQHILEKCYPGLLERFKNNPHLGDMLLSTGNLTLAELSYDYIWGTGVPLQSEDALNPEHWRGTGLLGEMLMQVREELHKIRRTEPGDMEVTPPELIEQETTRIAITSGNTSEICNVNSG